MGSHNFAYYRNYKGLFNENNAGDIVTFCNSQATTFFFYLMSEALFIETDSSCFMGVNCKKNYSFA